MLERVRSSRGAVSFIAVAVLASVTAVGLAGSGFSEAILDSLPGSAWLASNEKGDVILAGAANGAGLARVNVPGAAGTSMSVVHRGGFACVRSERPGGEATVNCIDDATFGDAGSLRVSGGQRVIRTGVHAYLINEAKGLVRPLNPRTLKPQGDPLEFEAPTSVIADDDGRLLVLELEPSAASVVEGAAATEPVSIGERKGNLYGVLVDGKFAVVAPADRQLTLFDGDTVDRRVTLPGPLGGLLVPSEVEGGDLPMLSRQDGQIEVVAFDTTTDEGRRVKVEAALPEAPTAYATSQGIFLPDPRAGTVVQIDTRSGAVETIDLGIGKGAGNFEVFVKDDRVWVNNPNGSKAVVIDSDGHVREVNKYDPDISEVDPFPESPEPPEPPPGPVPPENPDPGPPNRSTVTPGAPGGGRNNSTVPTGGGEGEPIVAAPVLSDMTAVGGPRSATLSWDLKGEADSYRLSCTPGCGTPSISPGALRTTVDGLTNGQEYEFDLTATNSAGSDTATASATPTGDVPDHVTDVQAQAQRGTTPNVGGPVSVSWAPDKSSGLKITRYVVTALNGAHEVPFDSPGSQTSMEIPGEQLAGGVIDDDEDGDWTFTVQAISERSGSELASELSQPSNAVDLFTVVPAPVPTVASQDKNVLVSWKPVASGRPMSYLLNGNPVGQELTGNVPGQNGATQEVIVIARDNADGKTASLPVSVTPHGPPIITTFSVTSPDYNKISVTYAIDWNGAPSQAGSNNTCTISSAPSCSRNGGQVTFNSAAGKPTIVLTATNSFGESAKKSAQVSVSNPPPPPPRGEVCADKTVCTVNYLNRFDDAGKDSFSPFATYPMGYQADIMCKGTGYGGRTFYKLGANNWVIAVEFPVINGQPVNNC
jgi:hypothetical protein